jgi:hypothetical protein
MQMIKVSWKKLSFLVIKVVENSPPSVLVSSFCVPSICLEALEDEGELKITEDFR